VKQLLAIGADVLGYHNIAQMLDVSTAGNAAVLGELAEGLPQETPPSWSQPQQNTEPAAKQPPKKRSGELWPDNRLTAGAAAPSPAPAGPALPPGPPGRPFLSLLRGNPRAVNALRSQLLTSGYEDDAETVGAIIDSVDEQVSPTTGGPGPGAVLTALRALLATTPNLQALDSVQESPRSGALDDAELVAGALYGVLDPYDAADIAAGGLDDGTYLSATGEVCTADMVRRQIDSTLETGAIGDNYRNLMERVDTRQDARKARKQQRDKAGIERTSNRVEARSTLLQRRLERRGEGSEARAESASARADSAPSSSTNSSSTATSSSDSNGWQW
jgi:hypothetical protein